MGRPRKTHNQALPDNLYIRTRIRKNGRVVKYYTYRLNGKKEISLGTDYNKACIKAAQLNLERGDKTSLITFTQVAKRYKSEVIPLKSENTRSANLVQLKPLLVFFENAPLEQIRPTYIRQYLDSRSHVQGAANNEVALFSHIWKYAREWGYIDTQCPADGIKRFEKKSRDVYISDEIYLVVYKYADQDIKDLMDLAYLTGQRPSDLVSLTLSHIKDNHLYITQQKTKAKLRIEIVGKIEEIINRRKEETKYYLFKTKKGERLTTIKLSKKFARLRSKVISLNPEYAEQLSNFQFRDLRAKSGTDKALLLGEESARQQLGHTSVKMTKTYIRKALAITPLKDGPTTRKES
ncbi:tyrosine-type recombinase/integrase [Phocoenobacter skyensis]|uniref:Tyrosine-type recombinase/integrase n=1 Tax=Phocoenobacter skyensis TaxID=97481 RepID=A0ABT9JIC8_9PAST|nr:tyrosine-type recombinase/integrase [Pasteurella skyensis]MDP8078375.1 tyrosine-type recombinase/integrase [Pasteurella skyensis]MDP8084533.1 tyrosine-type recombinase/integrase [Pasteurella skyensis]